MLQYSQCKIEVYKDTTADLKKYIAKKLRISEDEIRDLQIIKKSVDARKKPELYYNYTVIFSVSREKDILKKNRNNKNLTQYVPPKGLVEMLEPVMTEKDEKVVIVGSGPAGLLCAYLLAKCGRKPIIIERGAPMWERVDKVTRFWKDGLLDPETNVSFGEGGAGTFSDGKLNTGVKDKTGKKKFVLDTFIRHGAPKEIGYLTKPHIGTDELRNVILSMREEIEELGGTYYFHTKFVGFIYQEDSVDKTGRKEICGIVVENQEGMEETLFCDKCVLAIGHSARDTFELLKSEDVCMEAKPFAVGVRVEHLQKKINEIQYGVDDKKLPAADYKLTGKTSDGRGVYSFCMCPGGYVVNASSEEGRTVVNGMSNHARDSVNANSAIVVTVDEKDYGSEDVLAGMEFQRRLEESAYKAGLGKIPVQTLGDFINGVSTTEFGAVKPCTKGDYVPGDVKKILPSYISNGIMEGMEQFGKKMKGYADKDTLILGTETRTSSPVRILRDEQFESNSLRGVYPCGEGAGYAGGIMSAAMDGLRVAVQIVTERNEKEE